MSALLEWLTAGANLPRGLTRALRRSLAATPSRRHPDVGAWLTDVEKALAPPDDDPAGSARVGPQPRAAGRRRRPILAATLALVLGAGIGLGGGWAAVTWLDSRPASSAGAASVTISGPGAVTVGTPITLTARVVGAEHWVWTLPTGAYVTDEATVELTANSPGGSEVVLEARSPEGTTITAVHRLEVTDES